MVNITNNDNEKEEILTRNIFLDTSIFIKENFFAGYKLKAFLHYEQEALINLYITDITIKECLSNIEKLSENSYSTLKKALRELNNKAKIFKNIENLNYLFELQNNLKIPDEVKVLKTRFENMVKKHFKVIEIDSNKIDKIISDYFNSNPPFKEGKKKHEFPDALVLNSLESWCEKEKKKLYVVAEDEDMNTFQTKNLIPVKEYEKLLDQISFTYREELIGTKIEEFLIYNESNILKRIEDLFKDEFPRDGHNEYKGYSYLVEHFHYFEAEIKHHYIITIDEHHASVEIIIKANYSIDVSHNHGADWRHPEYRGNYLGFYETLTYNDAEITAIIYIGLPEKESAIDFWELEDITAGIPDHIEFE